MTETPSPVCHRLGVPRGQFKEQLQEMAELKRQLAESNKVGRHHPCGSTMRTRHAKTSLNQLAMQRGTPHQLYFYALVLNMKLNSLHSGRPNANKSNLDTDQLYDKCLQAKIAIQDWPNFVSQHF